jgi:hypothetical protein
VKIIINNPVIYPVKTKYPSYEPPNGDEKAGERSCMVTELEINPKAAPARYVLPIGHYNPQFHYHQITNPCSCVQEMHSYIIASAT